MNFLQLLEKKREGNALSSGEIQILVSRYTAGDIPDYQMAAFLMAVFFRGLDPEETRALTLAMRDSGEVLTFPKDSRPLVDKHSTGGVGDKVSLPLAPLLAGLGFRVPMISGRGLGITGGTLDKLDSIPGFKTILPRERIVEIVQDVGCVICGQTEKMVPADRKLYALRDVTATVPSMPLIVSSILSKKMAEEISALLLDVKFGAAAFMRTQTEARQLALAMVSLAKDCGISTRALLTLMDSPLGRAAGNWLEVKEAVDLLRHPDSESLLDLRELVIECAAHLLVQSGQAASLESAREQALRCLRSGVPRGKWEEMLRAQGADLGSFEKVLQGDSTAQCVLELKSNRGGVVTRSDARVIGEVVRDLGAGRLTKDSPLDYAAGLDRIAKPGDKLNSGAVLARIHAPNSEKAQAAAARLREAFELSDSPTAGTALIAEVVEG